MSRVQESIQKNERQLILDRQSLAHMENRPSALLFMRPLAQRSRKEGKRAFRRHG